MTFLKFIFIVLKVLFIVLWPFILIGGIIGWFLAGGDSSYISSQKPPCPDKKRLKKKGWLFDEDEENELLGPDKREEYTRRDIILKQRDQHFHNDNFWK